MVKISKWGGSLAVRLPKDLVEEGGYMEGEEVELALRRKHANGEVGDWSGWIVEVKRMRKTVPGGDFFDREDIYDDAATR